MIREIGQNLEAASSVRELRAVLKRFGDSAIEFELHLWIEKPTRSRVWDAWTDAIAAVKAAFSEAGITISFPQRTYESRNQEGFRVTAPEDIAAVADP